MYVTRAPGDLWLTDDRGGGMEGGGEAWRGPRAGGSCATWRAAPTRSTAPPPWSASTGPSRVCGGSLLAHWGAPGNALSVGQFPFWNSSQG